MLRLLLALLATIVWSGTAAAAEPIGQVKVATGAVTVSRGGTRESLTTGDHVFQADVITTGPDGSVGITFADNSRLSLGPSSELVIMRFLFNTTTHEGAFDSYLRKGTLAVKSGQIVEQTPEAMTITIPAAVLGIRGTELVVRAEGDPQ
ncbi:MAG: FecR domain-containing protein [Rhodospirillaceae bacterium]|nr:FecR domain-containing protein [Rhodospirillaceae bacterium]